MNMKILIADSFPDPHQNQLTRLGYTCTVDPGLDENTLADAIGDHEALIVRSTKVNANTMDNGSALKLVIRAGAGTNTIDKAYATSKGIKVCNVPGANSIAVAELVMGLILSIDRHLPANVADLKNQIWNKKKYSKARGLFGQTMGILGLGAIGLAVAERALAFGINPLVVAKPDRAAAVRKRIGDLGICEVDSMPTLLQQSDIVSLHLPANDDTRNLVNEMFLEQMQNDAILINTSRGDLIDEAALLSAMNRKGIRAGLDVFHNEPGAGDNQFTSAVAQHPNVCGTHHIGASTEQAQTAVADGVLRVIKSYQEDALIFCVNS